MSVGFNECRCCLWWALLPRIAKDENFVGVGPASSRGILNKDEPTSSDCLSLVGSPPVKRRAAMHCAVGPRRFRCGIYTAAQLRSEALLGGLSIVGACMLRA